MTAFTSLSVLIPVYNWDVRPLLRTLQAQAESLPGKHRIEIIVMDDGSDETYGISAELDQLPLVRYQRFANNQGRATIRNRLLDQASGEYVLLLDADMLPDQDDFLSNYLERAGAGADIVCGGISYQQAGLSNPAYRFYLHKSRKTEVVPAPIRARSPWRYLFTSNVMVRRTIVESVRFDPRFRGYGFEDTEWAIRLAAAYTIAHIDNTCTHMGLLTKRQTFNNMRASIDNYVRLMQLHPAETAGSGAARISGMLKPAPGVILEGADGLLSWLFYALPWHSIAFLIFQCDKMVLLAKALKKR